MIVVCGSSSFGLGVSARVAFSLSRSLCTSVCVCVCVCVCVLCLVLHLIYFVRTHTLTGGHVCR
jgi:hypothetical protein